MGANGIRHATASGPATQALVAVAPPLRNPMIRGVSRRTVGRAGYFGGGARGGMRISKLQVPGAPCPREGEPEAVWDGLKVSCLLPNPTN